MVDILDTCMLFVSEVLRCLCSFGMKYPLDVFNLIFFPYHKKLMPVFLNKTTRLTTTSAQSCD